MQNTFDTNQELKQLKLLISDFEYEGRKSKLKIINTIAGKKIKDPRQILKYQDLLLYLAAYPDSKQILNLVNSELGRLNEYAASLIHSTSEKTAIAFAGSGIYKSYFIGSFSFEMTSWLQDNFPKSTSFHSFGESERSSQEILGLSLLPAETWLMEHQHLPVFKWIKECRGSDNEELLSWILEAMKQNNVPIPIRDLLFDSLQLFISFDLTDKKNASSLLRVPKGNDFIHTNGLLKKINLGNLLNKRISKKITLSREEKSEYLSVAKFALLHLSRETDPVTYSNEDGLEVYILDRGFSIALFYMVPERRNALDSYVGYMIFKNRIPCGYGGAWIFGEKAKIGLNIFPSFRGGESTFLFSQILRLYKNRFRLKYFEAEPYQIGLDNPEGIASGAFWFYYKLGFRPSQNELAKIAEEEMIKIKKDRKYRTEAAVLKSLAHSVMFLNTLNIGTNSEIFIPDSHNISKLISSQISNEFHGDRIKAIEAYKKNIKVKTGISNSTFKSQVEISKFNSLLPLLNILCSKKAISKPEIALMIKLVRAKAAQTEFNYTQCTRQIQNWLLSRMKS